MRHYEIMFLVHPDQGDQVSAMIDRYCDAIKKNNGIIHRLENLGKRQLAYPINKIHKACYVLMNIECDQNTLDEIKNNFRFNDAIIRNLVLLKEKAITEPSPLSKEGQKRSAGIVASDSVAKKPKSEATVKKDIDEVINKTEGE